MPENTSHVLKPDFWETQKHLKIKQITNKIQNKFIFNNISIFINISPYKIVGSFIIL